MDEDGLKWLTRLTGQGDGTDGPPEWTSAGWLHHALYEWPEGDEE